MRRLGALLVIAAIALGTGVASAETGVSFGPRVGIAKASETDSDAKWLVGAALRAKFLPALGVEASIDYRQEDFGDDAVTVRTWPVQLTGLIYPIPFAYGAMGAGWYHTSFDFEDSSLVEDDTTQEFGWHFGAGLDVPLGTAAKVVGDIRYVFLDYDFQTVPGQGDEKDDFYMITVGLLFNL